MLIMRYRCYKDVFIYVQVQLRYVRISRLEQRQHRDKHHLDQHYRTIRCSYRSVRYRTVAYTVTSTTDTIQYST